MQKRTLGRTGLAVTELGMGGVFVASFASEFDQAKQAIRRAVDLGVNYIDTAPGYGNSEEVFGKALEGVAAPLIFSTKLGGRPSPFDAKSKDHFRQSFETSLKLLKRDRVDMLLVHEPDRPGQYDWWGAELGQDGPVLEFLDDLKRQKLIRYTGLGGTTAYEIARIMRTGRFDVVLTAFNYSILWREARHEIFPAAREQKMGLIIGSPLQQGVLARRFDKEIESGATWMNPLRRRQFRELYSLCDELKIPLPELGLRFVLSNPAVSTILMGPRSAQEVEGNVAAIAKGPLSADVLARLDQIHDLLPYRPYEEPFFMPLGRAYRGPGPAR